MAYGILRIIPETISVERLGTIPCLSRTRPPDPLALTEESTPPRPLPRRRPAGRQMNSQPRLATDVPPPAPPLSL